LRCSENGRKQSRTIINHRGRAYLGDLDGHDVLAGRAEIAEPSLARCDLLGEMPKCEAISSG